MSPVEAAKLLEIAPDATPEQIESRFHELRTKLEDKIAKAPTPGLKAKYRDSLAELTVAFETLTLSADASALPVLQRQKDDAGNRKADGGALKPEAVSTPAPAARPAQSRKSGNKEFVIVAIVAVVLLAVGGWWVMKTRAENEEKARVAAEAKARADAAAKAEQARIDQLTVQARTLLAETKVAWEAAEREERDAERRVSELRQELRGIREPKPGQSEDLNLRIESAQRYANWLRDFLLQHPAKIARAKLEEFLQAKAIDEAAALTAELERSLKGLQESLAASRNGEGMIELSTNLPVLQWEVTDPLDRVVQQGAGPARITGLQFARHSLRMHAPTFGDERRTIDVTPGTIAECKRDYEYTTVKVDGLSADARLLLNQKPAVFLADGSFALGGPSDVVAHRPGFLPCVSFLNEGATSLALDWIPADPRGMVDGFLRRIGNLEPPERALFLDLLHDATMATPLLDRARWIELCRETWSALDSLPPSAARVNGYLHLAWILSLRDQKLAAEALERAAETIVSLDLATVKKEITMSRADNPVWRRTPASGERFFAHYEASVPGDLLPLYRGYLYCGLDAAADRIKATYVASASSGTRDGATTYLDLLRKRVETDVNLVTPLQQALLLGDVATFNRVATAKTWKSIGMSIEDMAAFLWTFGLPRQATDLLLTRNSAWLPFWLIPAVRLGDRTDLLDRIVTGMRGKSNFTRAIAAREFALRGNRTKARTFLENFDATQVASVSTYGARALAFALIDDPKNAQAELAKLEKLPDLKPGVFPGSLADAIYALRRLGDAAGERRILETTNKKPADLANFGNWNWAGDIDLFVRHMTERRFPSPLARLNGWRSFYQTWLTDSRLRERDLPIGSMGYIEEAIILAHIDVACARERPDANRYNVPWFERVEASLKDRTPFYFPAKARDLGVPSGQATIQITVSPDGRTVDVETVSTDHPTFIEELKRSAADWTFYPALEWGQPVSGTYEFKANFLNK